jgi:hypothetical protein
MRDKFTELVNAGVASFDYTNISSNKPNTDELCKFYNNVFSIPSDTHMSLLDDGRRVITGHMINTQNWENFVSSCCWGAVDFRHSGAWSVCNLLKNHGLCLQLGQLNGDVVNFVVPCEPAAQCGCCPQYCSTSISKMPVAVASLTTSGCHEHFAECIKGNVDEAAENLNASKWVLGSNWMSYEEGVVGLIGNKVYKIKLV